MKKFIKILIVLLFFMCCFVVCVSASSLVVDSTDDVVLVESIGESVDLFLPDESENDILDEYIVLAEEKTFPDVNINITLDSLTEDNTDFVELFDTASLRIAGDPSGCYFGIQGGCYDGQYYYYSIIVKNSSKKQIDTRIVCATKNSDGTFSIVALNSGLMDILQHANDMTYNSNTGEIVIACCSGYEQRVCTISAEKLRNEQTTKTFKEYNLSCVISSIDYNKTRNQYVVATKQAKNYLVILDGDFNLVKGIGDKTTYASDSDWDRQGIYCDNKYIYYAYFLTSGDTFSNTRQNRIRIFDWSGNYIKTLLIDIPEGTDRVYELENIIFAEDKVLLGFNCPISQQNRSFCYVDITNQTYHIEYCPDENISNYIGVKNNNITSIMFRGVSTELYKFRVRKTGEYFVGWTIYRTEVDKWYYQNSEGTRAWYKEGNQPNGYEKVVYADKTRVSQTGLGGEHILMCAKWSSTNKFHITFLSNGGQGSMVALEVVYGIGANLTANAFTKTNRSFCGWNAYWSEINKWYYTDSEGNRGWFAEGFEPNGYKKYVYSNKQNVVQTAYAGSHIYMYAVWDEYRVYSDANGAKIKISGIKPQVMARNCSGYINLLESYTENDLYAGNLNFRGCYLYRKEVDAWYYESPDGNKRMWCKEGTQPQGYKKYLKTFNNGIGSFSGTALVGETLILVAQWS